MSAVVILRVALVAAAATSAVCGTWVMLEYGVHWWLAILAAGSAAGVVAGIRQHRGLAILYLFGTFGALMDLGVMSTGRRVST